MIFDRHVNLKYEYGNSHFWCRGYYVDTVGRNARVIEEYISLAVKSRKMQTTAGKYHFERFVVRRFFAAAVENQPRSRIRIIRSSHHRCTGFKPVFPGSFNGNTSCNFRVPTCPFLLVPQFFRVLLTLWSRCQIKPHYHCSFNNYRSILSGILSLCP